MNNGGNGLLIGFMAVVIAMLGIGCSNKEPANSAPPVDTATKVTSSNKVPGVTDTSIKIGILNAFTGAPFQAKGGQDAVEAYVQYVNENGGIHGRKMELVVEDNEYTPAGTVDAARKVITQDEVFAIPYSFGTSSTVAIKDYVNKEGVPVLGLGEGTPFFDPPSKYMFAIGTPYSYQGAISVRYVAETLSEGKPAVIAFMGQDDAFGKDPFKGVEAAVKQYNNLSLGYTAFHKRDAVDISDQVVQLKNSGADYLLLSATIERTGIILKELAAQKVNLKGIFSVSLASIDNKIFEIAGDEYVDRYYGVQSFYTWDQADQPSVQKTVELLKKQGKENVIQEKNMFFWYSWNNMSIFGKALEKAGKDLTREGFVTALESFQQEDGGGTNPPITYGPNDRISGDSAFVVKAEKGENGVVWKKVSDFLNPPENVIK